MWDRKRRGLVRRSPKRGTAPGFDSLEGRELMATASLAAISPLQVPTTLGAEVPLNGSASTDPSVSYSISSSNPDIKASIADGQFLSLTIRHTAASGSTTDVSFSGTVTIQLTQNLAPDAVQQIVNVITSGFYNNNPSTAGTFNRIANGFPTTSDYILQGGSITGTTSGNSGQPGTPFIDDFNPQLAFTGNGQLAMANSGPDTNDTQFFITTAASPNINSFRSLDFGYTIIGQVVSDPDNILSQMTKVAVNSSTNQPLSSVFFTTALSSTNPNGVAQIDATKAAAGETSTITVTAKGSDGTTSVQSFPVTVIPNNNSSGTPVVEKPYLQQLPYATTVLNPGTSSPSVVYQQSVRLNQKDIFQIQGYAATPNDPLTYNVSGGVTTSSTGEQTFAAVQNATATVDQATGVVTVVPTAGFSGTISLLVGVRDQTNRAGIDPATNAQYALESPPNYDYHRIQLTVNSSSSPVALTPIALATSVSASANTPQTVQLNGKSANPATSTGLTYSLLSQPTHGTISNFNPNNGTLIYTPNPNTTGTDTFQYQVTDHGTGSTNLTSPPGTVTVNIGFANTGAVRLIGNVLVVTPVPSKLKDTNIITVAELTSPNGSAQNVLQVTVNGTIDALQPLASNINRIVIFGSKSNDTVIVNPNVDSGIPVMLDGGHGGFNVLQAANGPTRLHGWFGKSTLKGGQGINELVGRAGQVKFKPSVATTYAYAGVPAKSYTREHFHNNTYLHIQPSSGTFYRVVKGRLVKAKSV
ncbi:peptidylprolyl isomerase [Singulisphaera rosea]